MGSVIVSLSRRGAEAGLRFGCVHPQKRSLAGGAITQFILLQKTITSQGSRASNYVAMEPCHVQ
jgi:hypothetical protein